MFKRYKQEDPIEVVSIDGFLEAIHNFSGDEVLRISMSDNILFLQTDHMPFVQQALQNNHFLNRIEINGQEYRLPLSQDFLNKFVPLNKLLHKIETFKGGEEPEQRELQLEISSNRILFTAHELEQILMAIKRNKKISEINITKISIEIGSVYTLLNSFFRTAHLSKLTLPLLQAVDCNSLREVSEFFDELPLQVMNFNRQSKAGQNSWKCFAYGAWLNRKRAADYPQHAAQYGMVRILPTDIMQHIQTFVCSKTKKLVLPKLE